jgi:xanthine dehydrogenase accessory factor
MDANARRAREATAIVLGCDAIASSVAHGLHRAGWSVVLVDDIDPPAVYRGLSFANAWYLGSAEVAGVAACFCSSLKSIPSMLHRHDLVAATSWSWRAVATLVGPEIIVDARVERGMRDALLARAPAGVTTIGCGPGFTAAVDVDMAVDASHALAGRWTRAGALSAAPGDPPTLGGAGVERFVTAPRTGRMRTRCRIGDRVSTGDDLGDVNGAPLAAPIDGVLRGLAARGARVDGGRIVAEVDPRGVVEHCHGLDERGMRVAGGILTALDALETSATVRANGSSHSGVAVRRD